MFISALNAVLVTSITTLIFIWARRRLQRRTYPPGPPPKFLVGNLHDLPFGGNEWDQWEQLGKKYGSDIVYLSVLRASILVINSYKAATDLLDKKSAVYSDRPRFVMIKELMKFNWNLVVMSYGKVYVAGRRVVQQNFQPSVVATSHRPIMEREVISLLLRLLSNSDDLALHLKQMAAAIIMMVSYGHRVTSIDDKYVRIAEAVRENEDKTPGNAIVDVLPFLKYVPTWFPGAGFKRHALFMRQLSINMREAPYQMVKDQLASGVAVPSMVSALLEEKPATGGMDFEEFVKDCAAVVYSAGADTTAAAMINFFLAMTLYPDVQRRAQQELDDVIGRDRLPTFEDREQLPYINCIVKETLRWKAVSPLGVPHASMEDDEYRDAFIPKGTTVVANISAMLHDEAAYKTPQEFIPERFLPSDGVGPEPDPARIAFGFGRRICPGRFFADDSLWLTVVLALHMLNITQPDGTGDEKITWSSGLVSLPSKFSYAITPRFPSAPDLLAGASQHH
ncbi:cytochrome P450 [Amylostereum chailletii]|nr:cytochrome P450 [Amylostereum chailletii]